MGYSFTFKFSENEIDFSPRSDSFFNYHKFLINEFFNASNQEMALIMFAYRRRFGESSYNYVMKTYFYGWRNGKRTLSNIQEARVISLMPDFLNKSAKERLYKIKEEARYKLGIEEILGAIRRTVQHYFYNQSNIYSKENIYSQGEIFSIFQKELDRVKCLEIPQQKSYFRTEDFYILNEDEKREALLIAKYIVFNKLQRQFDQIEKDFNTFLPLMNYIKRGRFKVLYQMDIFNIKIDITKITFLEITFPIFTIKEIESLNRFKQYSDKYLASELFSIHQESNKAIANAFLNSNDLKLFFAHYDELSLSDSEINMKSSFKGEAGTLYIDVQMKSIKMLKTSFAKSISRILIFSILFLGIILWSIEYEVNAILIFGGLVGGPFYLGFLITEISQLKYLKSEIKQHG